MSTLLIGGVSIPVAPGSIQRPRTDLVDRARAMDGTYKSSATGNAKRDWIFSTPPVLRSFADLVEPILERVASQVVSGDLIGGASNLALRSEEADNAAWTKTNVTVVANASQAPDGTGTMDALVETAVSGQHSIRQTYTAVAGTTYSWSAYVRPNGRTKASLVIDDGTGFSQTFFDVAGGSIISNTNGGGNASGTPIINAVAGGTGVYRLALTAVAAHSGAAGYELRLLDATGAQSYLGVITQDLHVWGMQFQTGALQSYAKTTTAAVALPTVNACSEVTGWRPIRTQEGHRVVLDIALHEV